MDNSILFKEISIQIGIGALKSKRDELYAKKPKVPQKAGSGYVVDEVEEIGQTYEQIYEAMTLLFDNTVSFLNNAQNSMSATDEAIANTFI